jgi:hypothetical protein
MAAPPAEEIVESLLARPFSCRSLQEKKFIIEKGRPKPPLPELKQKTKAMF